MKTLIVGAGGIGGYFGARLTQAGAPSTFLVRPQRAAQLRERGLVLQSPLGSWSGMVETITADALVKPADLIVLTCKAHDLPDVLEEIAPAVGQGTAILPFLNGIAHIEALAERYPKARLWGGVAHLSVMLMADGTIRHLNRLDSFAFGPVSPRSTDFKRARALQDLLCSAGVTARAERDILAAMWHKLAFLGTLAGITCLMRADIGTIMSTDFGGAAIEELFAECTAVAAAEGFALPPEALLTGRAQLLDRNSTSTASMLRDVEAGKPTEHSHVLGDLVHRAARHGIAAPLLQLSLTHLQAYESLRERNTMQNLLTRQATA